LQCGLLRSNFSFAIILYLLGFQLRRKQIIAVSFVIRANEFFFVHQFSGNLSLELIEIFGKPLAEDLKTAMPDPEILNPISPIAN